MPPKAAAPTQSLKSVEVKVAGEAVTYRVDDCILIRGEGSELPFVAKITDITVPKDHTKRPPNPDRTTVWLTWFYRPEEVLGGRKSFHGSRELLASDHADSAALSTVLSKARVVPMADYIAEVNAARRASGDGEFVPDDLYFQRFKFCVAKRGGADGGVAPARFEPDRVVVVCECALPFNPDQRYVECGQCGDACHPACVGLPEGTTAPPDGWVCKRCAAPGDGVDNSDTTETTNIG